MKTYKQNESYIYPGKGIDELCDEDHKVLKRFCFTFNNQRSNRVVYISNRFKMVRVTKGKLKFVCFSFMFTNLINFYYYYNLKLTKTRCELFIVVDQYGIV